MATANVGRYVVVTKERYERDAWRSEYFVGAGDPDPANALFRECDCSPPFGSPEEAELFLRAGALECFVVPFEFASLWRTLSIAHPELTSRTFGTMMSNAAKIKASRVSR